MIEKALSVARHEPTDVGLSFIWSGVTLVVGTVVSLALLVLWLFPNAIADRPLHVPLSPYPDPQLQTNPPADMAKFHREEMRWLTSAGWIDKAHGIAHISITDAMRGVALEGIAGWPTPAGPRP